MGYSYLFEWGCRWLCSFLKFKWSFDLWWTHLRVLRSKDSEMAMLQAMAKLGGCLGLLYSYFRCLNMNNVWRFFFIRVVASGNFLVYMQLTVLCSEFRHEVARYSKMEAISMQIKSVLPFCSQWGSSLIPWALPLFVMKNFKFHCSSIWMMAGYTLGEWWIIQQR